MSVAGLVGEVVSENPYQSTWNFSSSARRSSVFDSSAFTASARDGPATCDGSCIDFGRVDEDRDAAANARGGEKLHARLEDEKHGDAGGGDAQSEKNAPSRAAAFDLEPAPRGPQGNRRRQRQKPEHPPRQGRERDESPVIERRLLQVPAPSDAAA